MSALKKNTIFGQCIQDNAGVVQFQNDICYKMCGNVLNTHCTKCDLKSYHNNSTFSGIYNYKNVLINGHTCDVAVLKEKDKSSVWFYPIKKREELLLDTINLNELTKQERDILNLILKGLTNAQILEKLKIEKSTLKTHINHIYKKNKNIKEMRMTLLGLRKKV